MAIVLYVLVYGELIRAAQGVRVWYGACVVCTVRIIIHLAVQPASLRAVLLFRFLHHLLQRNRKSLHNTVTQCPDTTERTKNLTNHVTYSYTLPLMKFEAADARPERGQRWAQGDMPCAHPRTTRLLAVDR